jgi:hypothetical protein
MKAGINASFPHYLISTFKKYQILIRAHPCYPWQIHCSLRLAFKRTKGRQKWRLLCSPFLYGLGLFKPVRRIQPAAYCWA